MEGKHFVIQSDLYIHLKIKFTLFQKKRNPRFRYRQEFLSLSIHVNFGNSVNSTKQNLMYSCGLGCMKMGIEGVHMLLWMTSTVSCEKRKHEDELQKSM